MRTNATTRRAPRAALAAAALLLAGCQTPEASPEVTLAELTRDCARCHGPTGFTKDPAMPRLAGRTQADLTAALSAIRAGTLPHPPMAVPAARWTDTAIADLARYYSRIR